MYRPPLPHPIPQRRLAFRLAAIGGLLIVAASAAPVSAAPPYHRVIASIDGLIASADTFTSERTGELDRYVWTTLSFGENRVHTRGERPAAFETVCLHVVTYWLPVDRASDDEFVAVADEGGCETAAGAVEIEARQLNSARLAGETVTSELQYCSAHPGWETLCQDLPDSRTISVAAELVGVGEMHTSRGRWREPLPWTPDCIELRVYSDAWRTVEGSMWIDGSAHAVRSWSSLLSDGHLFFHVFCRR